MITNSSLNTSSATSKTLCETGYSSRFHMTDTQYVIIAAFNVSIIGFLNLILNAMVVISLRSTGQLKRPAMRLFLCQSCANIGVSFVTPTITCLLFTQFAHQLNCMVESLFYFAERFVIMMSCLILGLIALDRYACMRYLTRYKLVMSKKRVHMLVAGMVVFSIINGGLICIGTHVDMFGELTGVSVVLTLIVFVPMLGLYIKSQRMVQRHLSLMKTMNVSNKSFMNNFDRSLTKLVRVEVITYAAFYSLFVASSATNVALGGRFDAQSNGKTRGWYEFGIFLGFSLSNTTCVSNAVIFLKMNKKANRFWRNVLKKKFSYMSSIYSASSSSTQSKATKTTQT